MVNDVAAIVASNANITIKALITLSFPEIIRLWDVHGGISA